MEKLGTTKPMLLVTCMMAGIGVGILGHVLMGDGAGKGTEVCAPLDVDGLNKMVSDHADTINSGQAMMILAQTTKTDYVGVNSMDDDWLMTRDATLVSLNDFVKEKPVAKYTPKTQFIGCNIAYSIGHRETDWTDPDTKAKMHRQTRYTMIFRHGENGWKIGHLHFSVPVPTKAAADAGGAVAK